MSLQTSITLNSSQYVNEMKKVGDSSKEAMERVKKTSQEASQATNGMTKTVSDASKATQQLTDKLTVGGVKLGDLNKLLNDSSGASSIEKAAAAGSVLVAILTAAKKVYDQLEQTVKDLDDALKESDKLTNDFLNKMDDAAIKTAKSYQSAAAELRKLILTGDESAATKAKEEILLERIKGLYKDITLEGKNQLDIAKQLYEIEAEQEKRVSAKEKEKLQRQIKDLESQIEDAKAVKENKNTDTSGIQNLGRAFYKQTQEGTILATPLVKSLLKPFTQAAGEIDLVPGIAGKGTIAKQDNIIQKASQELALAKKQLKELEESSKKTVEAIKKLGEAANKDAQEAQKKKAAEDAEAYRKKEEEDQKKVEAYHKEQDEIEKSNAKANRKLQNKTENLSITDKNTLSYKQAMDALAEEILDMKSAVDKNGDAVYDPQTVERYKNLQKEKLAKDYEKSSIEDFLNQNRITNEVVKTNELTRKGGFQGGAVVIDNTQKQMLELQKGIRQVLEEVSKNTKGIEEKL